MTKYKISTSLDGSIFEFVSCDGDECEFDANSDKNGVVGNEMPSDLTALVVRLYPVEWAWMFNAPGMRWGICGEEVNSVDQATTEEAIIIFPFDLN